MISILAAVVGTFVATSAGNILMAKYCIRLGWQLCADDRALDPGDTTGRLPVGESSGKHALPEWPGDDETAVLPAVTA